MLAAIQEFFRLKIEPDASAGPGRHGLQLATAALLFEVLRADHDEHPDERTMLEQALRNTFSLSDSETRELAELADCEAAESVSLYQFTGLINQYFSAEEKVQLLMQTIVWTAMKRQPCAKSRNYCMCHTGILFVPSTGCWVTNNKKGSQPAAFCQNQV